MKLLFINILKEIYRYFFYKRYREFCRLHDKYAKKTRYQYTPNVKFLSYTIDVPDLLSFVWQFKEIYVEEIYKFDSENQTPTILDCGANIGLSCLYFKNLFPNAMIKAFEADPDIAKTLKLNLERNNATDIEIINKAVWIHDQGIEFSIDGADGGSINSSGNKIKIASIRLKEYLKAIDKISLLKIDIEGAEYDVLKDCANDLSHVRNIFIEYHSWNSTEQRLSEILDILEKNGFRYYIEDIGKRKHPFINKSESSNMDLQLNIFGYKK